MVKPTQVSARALEAALGSWPAWCIEPPRLRKDVSGLSNQSYLLTSGTESFVIRINASPAKPGINRLREKNILLSIQDRKFAPELVFWHKDYLVTRFVPNLWPHRISARQLASVFAQIHQTRVVASDRLDAWARLDDYLVNLPRVTKIQCGCVALMQSCKPPDYHKSKPCLCHNDMLKTNLLLPYGRSATEQIIVIDWEYAQLGHPAFDLAVYAETCQLSFDAVDDFLQHYNDNDNDNGDVSSIDLQLHRKLYRLIELLWRQTDRPERDMTEKFDLFYHQLLWWQCQ